MGKNIELKIEHLVLDSDNPRITHSEGQQQALQNHSGSKDQVGEAGREHRRARSQPD